MKSLKLVLLFFVVSCAYLIGKENVRIVPMTSTPQSEEVSIKFVFPEDDQVEMDNRIWIQIRLRGFPLGVLNDFPTKAELATQRLGQSIHVILDNKPYFPVVGPKISPFDDEGDYYTALYKFESPHFLKEGEHILRVFPCRAWGESLKNANSFDAVRFFIKKKQIVKDIDLNGPYLTFNEPSSSIQYKKNSPILLDFYLKNCELSQDGYKVKAIIDGKYTRMITEWVPYYIYGLTSGKHTIKLILVDKKNKQVDGEFNKVVQSIFVK